jgi:rhodanese-related sulfurtransferase
VRAALLGLIVGLRLVAPVEGGHGSPPAPLRWVSASELKGLLDGGPRQPTWLIDLRPAAAFGQGHLPGARSMPIAELRFRAREIPPGRIVLYCDCAAEDMEAAYGLLWSLGWNDVRALANGLAGWIASGYSIAR